MTPLYTGADHQGRLSGLFVDQGWLPEEYAGLNAHWTTSGKTAIEGVVVYGEGKSFTGKNNDDINKIRIDLEEFISPSEGKRVPPEFSNH